MKSLATLTCTVLRKSLPKVPLPIFSKKNPIKFVLSNTTDVHVELELSAQLQSSTTLHTSVSAPQLTSLKNVCRTNSRATSPWFRAECLQINPTCTQSVLTDDPASSQSAKEPVSTSSDCQELPSTSSAAELCQSQTTHSTEEFSLSLCDNFFPELAESDATRISKTHSSPQLPTEGVSECARGLFDMNLEKQHRQQAQKEAEYSKCRQTPSFPLIIPTASSLSEESHDRPELGAFEGADTHSASCEDRPFVQGSVASAMPFCEVPVPEILGHITPSDPEPLYKKSPPAERYYEYVY